MPRLHFESTKPHGSPGRRRPKIEYSDALEPLFRQPDQPQRRNRPTIDSPRPLLQGRPSPLVFPVLATQQTAARRSSTTTTVACRVLNSVEEYGRYAVEREFEGKVRHAAYTGQIEHMWKTGRLFGCPYSRTRAYVKGPMTGRRLKKSSADAFQESMMVLMGLAPNHDTSPAGPTPASRSLALQRDIGLVIGDATALANLTEEQQLEMAIWLSYEKRIEEEGCGNLEEKEEKEDDEGPPEHIESDDREGDDSTEGDDEGGDDGSIDGTCAGEGCPARGGRAGDGTDTGRDVGDCGAGDPPSPGDKAEEDLADDEKEEEERNDSSDSIGIVTEVSGNSVDVDPGGKRTEGEGASKDTKTGRDAGDSSFKENWFGPSGGKRWPWFGPRS